MDIEELLKFIEEEDRRLKEHYKLDDQKHILARTVKLMEELGELCNDVLACNSLQRNDKLEKHDRKNIRYEFADVLFTTLLLAKAMGIDLERSIAERMEKIKERSY